MRVLLLTAAAIFSLGCGTAWAQIAAMPNVTTPPSSTLAPATPPSSTQAPAFPGVANSPHAPGAAGSALGAIPLNLASPLAGSSTGAIQICPTAETAGSSADIPVDATDATTSAPAGFGTSAMSGSCNAGSPASSPGVISGAEFVDGSVPLSATEAGGLGLSPLIAGPILIAPSAACPSSPTPYDSAGAMGTPPVSAC
jgi:hypothetical protein